VRSARRYPLVALLCVLVSAGVVSAVSVAFAGSPGPPPKTALYANDASCSKAGITFSGGQNTVNGYSHSNGAFVVSGSKNAFGPSDAVCTPSVSGSNNTFNGAGAPAHGLSLDWPETFNQSTVCSGATHTGTSITISSGTPSGIYCYTGSITLSESNLTAKVTLVAPSITLSGSSLDLTPAYQDLLAYDTNTTLGNSGLVVSGSSITTHGATLYGPYAAINLSGAKYAWDGLIEGDTITISGAQSTYTGEGPLPTGTNFTIGGNALQLLYPGTAPQQLNLTINNPNPVSINVNSLTATVSGISGGSNTPNPCTSGDFNIVQINPAALPFTAPPGTSTLSADGVTTANQPTLQMIDQPWNQNGCKGATLTLSYSGSATG
jgi:hypothetical protein